MIIITNSSFFFVLIILIWLLLITFVFSFFIKDRQKLSIQLVLFIASVLLWITNEILFFLASEPDRITYLFNTRVTFIVCTVISFFFLTIRFYRLDEKINFGFSIMFLAYPIITFILGITSNYHNILYKSVVINQISPIHVLDFSYGIWLYITVLFCYMLLFISFIVIITQHKLLPDNYKLPSYVYITSFSLPAIMGILQFIFMFKTNILIYLVSISTLLIMIAIISNAEIDFLLLAKNDIFNHLEEFVMILNNDRVIVEVNRAAQKWLGKIGFFNIRNATLDDIFYHLDHQNDAGVTTHREKALGTDILMLFEGQYLFYNVSERELTDKKGIHLGTHVTFLNVSRYKKMISQLEKTAGIDSLTGLSNRSVFINNRKIYDHPNYYPLSIIIGDVNGLKRVNDDMGHQYGDILLKVVSLHIKKHSPPRATIARIGGDEFYILLPNTDEFDAKQVMLNIQYSLEEERSYPFQPSISMGVATKKENSQDFNQLIYDADQAMYKDKGDRRR